MEKHKLQYISKNQASEQQLSSNNDLDNSIDPQNQQNLNDLEDFTQPNLQTERASMLVKENTSKQQEDDNKISSIKLLNISGSNQKQQKQINSENQQKQEQITKDQLQKQLKNQQFGIPSSMTGQDQAFNNIKIFKNKSIASQDKINESKRYSDIINDQDQDQQDFNLQNNSIQQKDQKNVQNSDILQQNITGLDFKSIRKDRDTNSINFANNLPKSIINSKQYDSNPGSSLGNKKKVLINEIQSVRETSESVAKEHEDKNKVLPNLNKYFSKNNSEKNVKQNNSQFLQRGMSKQSKSQKVVYQSLEAQKNKYQDNFDLIDNSDDNKDYKYNDEQLNNEEINNKMDAISNKHIILLKNNSQEQSYFLKRQQSYFNGLRNNKIKLKQYPDNKQYAYTEQQQQLQQKYSITGNFSTLTQQQFRMFMNSLSFTMTIKIQKFKQNLKERSSYFNKKLLTEHEYEMIKDKSVFRKQESKYRKYVLKQIKQFGQKIEDEMESNKCSIPALMPDSIFLQIFDIIHFTIILLSLFYIPLEVFTQSYFRFLYEGLWDVFIVITFVIFVFDIIITCNIGYYDQGELVLNRKKIILNYLKKDLISDILSIIPLIETLNQYGANYQYLRLINFLIFLKIHTMFQIYSKYEEHYTMHQQRIRLAVLKLSKLTFYILFVAHLFASCFIGLSTYVTQGEYSNLTWVTKYDSKLETQDYEWFSKYIYSFYWSVTTMTTVGYGDITPANIYEACFVTAAMLISGFIYAYTLNTVGTIINELNKMQEEFNEKMRIFNRYLISKKISHNLQLETRRYLQHKNEAQKIISPEEESEVLGQLSLALQKKILIQSHMQLISQCNYFSQNFTNEFLEQLSLKSHSQNYIHDQPIFDGEIQPYIYIIESGKVQIYSGNRQFE